MECTAWNCETVRQVVVFFFLPAPCALEALTVINTFCFDCQSSVWKSKWDKNLGVTNQHAKQDSERPRVWGPRLMPLWVSPILPQKHCILWAFQWYAACSCIICHQAKTAMSKRMSCLLIGAGCSPFTTGGCCPYRGSWPPSDLVTRTMRFAESAGLCVE